MTLVSQKAHNFIAPAILPNGKIINDFDFKKYAHKKTVMLFFWPMDFTFICPTEIIEINNSYSEFEKRNVCIVGISIDSVYVHNAWRNTPIIQGGVGKIKFPMISDFSKKIQKLYNINHPQLKIALRASFIIDSNWIVRHQLVNDLPIGRNTSDIIRTIDALQFHEKFGDVCPANWTAGKKGMKPSPKGVIKYMSKNFKKN